MSTSTEYMDGLNAPVERRFYPRVTPPTPIYVAFGSNNLGVLHNVSENGFQVATPSELPLNSVFRVFLSLNGAAKTIAVTVRTIWTDDVDRRSGIQLLDLNDEDRNQIRQWVEFEMSRGEGSTPWFLPKNGDHRSAEQSDVDRNPNARTPADGRSVGRNPVDRDSRTQRPPEASRAPRVVPPTPTEQTLPQATPAWSTPPPTAMDAAAAAVETSFASQGPAPSATEAHATDANFPPIANPFDDPGPNSPFEQFPAVPLPIHGQFEYAPPPKKTSRTRHASRWRSNLRTKPLILWAAALALVYFGANALVRYKINRNSRHFASEAAKYAPPTSDGASAPVDDSGASAPAQGPADTQPSANSSQSPSEAPSSTAPVATTAQNDSSSAATPLASRSAVKNSDAGRPAPRRESSSDVRENRAYAATAPPASERTNESASASQPTPRSWNAPAPNRSSSTVSASDAPQSPNVTSSSEVSTQSTSTPIASQSRPTPPASGVQQPSGTNTSSNSTAASTNNNTATNAPPRTQPSANSQSSTYASNANAAPPSRPQSQIYNANAPAQRSAIIGSINSVHSSGIFDSNDSTSAATNSFPASRGASANDATRPISNSSVTASDVPQERDLEIAAPKGLTASWVDLPGEHIVRSQVGTVRIRRFVRVPGERIPGQRWLWRGKLNVTLGDVVNRIDPSVVQASGASGSLTVMASIDKDGYVTDLKPLYGNFALLPSVSRTVRNWHYEPTYLDSKRAETQAQIEFDLRPTTASNRSTHP